MISFRYHIVTIIAVFLALAIGLLGGAAFVQPALQEQLQEQTDRLRNDLDDRTQQIGDLRDQMAALNGFADSVMPYLTTGKLTGTPVVLVTQTGVEDEVLAQAQSALSDAGARILTTVSATDQLVSQDPTTQEQLATIVGEPTASAEELPKLAAEALAQGLSPSTTVIGGQVLDDLLSAGFLAPVGPGPSQATLEEIGAPGQVVVVLSGGRGEEPTLPPEAFAVPLVATAGRAGRPRGGGGVVAHRLPVRLPRARRWDGRAPSRSTISIR